MTYPDGFRWQLVYHLIDGLRFVLRAPAHRLGSIGILQYSNDGVCTDDWRSSRTAREILANINKVIDEGIGEFCVFVRARFSTVVFAACKAILQTPHLVLLSTAFYRKRLLDPLAQWAVVWLGDKGFKGT